MSKCAIRSIGIIAEDESDFCSIRILIQRLANTESISMKRFLGKGCGKIKRKCNSWANQFIIKGCSHLIIVHDLDTNNVKLLYEQISNALNPNPFKNYLICIPVQELEAWLLSDPEAIRKGMKLRKTPKIKYHPESINSPKEYLEKVVHQASDGEKIYIPTNHNEKIASELSLKKAKKCSSFIPLSEFISANI